MTNLEETYNLLWSRLDTTVPSQGFPTEKDQLFYLERDLDRKIQLLMVASIIDLGKKLEKSLDTSA